MRPSGDRLRKVITGLVTQLCVFSACVAFGEPMTRILTWKPGSEPEGPNAPRLEAFRDGHALHFSRAKATRLDLGQGKDGELRITGALTLKAVVQLDAEQKGKVALISKWRLDSKARSYEFGVDSTQSLFFTISPSGNWDQRGRQLLSTRPLRPGVPYAVAAVYEPGRRMALYVNGVASGETTASVPDGIFDSPTPVLIGNRAGGERSCGFDGLIARVEVWDSARDAASILQWSESLGLTEAPEPTFAERYPHLDPPYDLDVLREQVRNWYGNLQAPGKPYGAYRLTPERPPDLYASADVAWIRWMMNDLDLTEAQRREWIGFIQDQQEPDGTYRHITGHCKTHAFCHATGALNMLGGKHRHRPRILDPYRNVERMPEWLDGINWVHQWGASHDIWGAGVPLACTPSTPDAWRNALFEWLDAEVDPETGFWRKGVVSPTPMTYVGGAFHIWPIYAAMQRPIPYPERVVDSVLKLRNADGSLDARFGYGGMDCVWALQYVSERMPYRRQEVLSTLAGNIRGMMAMYNEYPHRFLTDAHGTEARIAILAITQAALPRLLVSEEPWRNPWHRPENFVIRFEGD